MGLKENWQRFNAHRKYEGNACIKPLLARKKAEKTEGTNYGGGEAYEAWLKKQLPDEKERLRQHKEEFSMRLSFLIPVCNARPEHLSALADSLLQQTNDSWEACFYDGASSDAALRQLLTSLPEKDKRFKVEMGEKNLGIAGNTNEALKLASGQYVALCDHDDLLAPDAVYHVLCAARDGADLIYTDEDKCDAEGKHFFQPNLKPDFAPDTLRSGNYICHLTALKKSLMDKLEGMRDDFEGSQDHDLVLRAYEKAGKITHIARILYHWRMVDTSYSHTHGLDCVQSSVSAVYDHLIRSGISGRVYADNQHLRLEYPAAGDTPVTVIVQAEEHGVGKWLHQIWKKIPDQIVEFILIGTRERPTMGLKPVRLVEDQESLTTALNKALRAAKGQYILFIRQGLMPMEANWMKEMMMYARRPDVGCVGTVLWSPEQGLYHAAELQDGVLPRFTMPRMILDRTVRNVSAVSGCCMLARREKLLAADGFKAYASDLRTADLCLRLQSSGYLHVYTPYARMTADAALFARMTEKAGQGDVDLFLKRHGVEPLKKYEPAPRW